MTKSDSKGLFIGYIVVAVIACGMMTTSAIGKFTLNPGAVKVIHERVGVPLGLFPVLGALLIAGGVGLLAGIVRRSLGVAAATGLVLYFSGAMVGHLLAGDVAGLNAPIVPFLVSVIVLFLRLKSSRQLAGA